MNTQQAALLEVIQQCKPPEISDLEAAINTISSHAETIRRLQDALMKISDVPASRHADIALEALNG